MGMRPAILFPLLVSLLVTTNLSADPASFDLAGPKIEVKVTRAGRELPISQTPNLAPGDRLWIHSALPSDQSARYLLIACFLRGSTNPPPDNWFTRVETWDKKVADEGVVVTVPDDAQQALLFLAPTTGGDFTTLRNAVKGRPGAFVRASQDLNAASFDRARYETYVNNIQKIPSSDTKQLKQESDLLARSLDIKINQDCFNRSPGQEIVCLTSGENAVVMDDGHTSLVAQLTSGATADLLSNATSTPAVGGGYYSAYIGSVVDVVRIMSNVHTAQYQYIPALAMTTGDDLNLKLNNPPSFHNPKSVLVIGLPAVQAAQLPPLHAVDPTQVLCLTKPSLVFPVEGAPLIFSSSYAHGLMLHIKSPKQVDLPLVASAAQGGLTLSANALSDLPQLSTNSELRGTVEGNWGFDSYTGPTFNLQVAPSRHLTLSSSEANQVVVGREVSIDFNSDGAACIDSIQATTSDGITIPVTWSAGKSPKPHMLTVSLALKNVMPGPLLLQVKQYGQQQPEKIALNAYADPPTPRRLVFHAGDTQAVLTGKGLDQITSVIIDGLLFTPGNITVANEEESLPLSLPNNLNASSLKPASRQTAYIKLKDGRVLELAFTVDQSRPRITLASKNIQMPSSSAQTAFLFSSPDDLPLNATLTFFINTEAPAKFSRDEKIEVATQDGSLHTQLSFDDGSLVLEDAHTVLATLYPQKAFGDSAFGSLQFRAVTSDGSGDWQPLANLIRVPVLKEVHCPIQQDASCTLSGDNLYLINSISSDASFDATGKVVTLPPNFAGTTLTVPRPNGTLLYLKLRDEPTSVDTVSLPVLPSAQ